MCRLNGDAGLVILGVEPSLLYPDATPGRHAVLLASCITGRSATWAAGFLEPFRSRAPGPVAFLDPSRPGDPKQATRFSVLAAAFDRAGREALLVERRA